MDASNIIYLWIPSLILIVAAVDDLKTRKIHNWLVGTCFIVATVSVTLVYGWQGFTSGFVASSLALTLTLPLVLVKALGAGDMKIMLAFAMVSQWQIVFWVIVYALMWGAILGLIKAFIDKRGLLLLRNTFFIATRKLSASDPGMTKIPFSIALIFGWLTQLTLNSGAGDIGLW